jgi:hypothetical protein
MSFINTLKKSLEEVHAKRADPWHLRLEAARGKVGDDGVERISTHTLFDILEVPQRRRNAGACTTGETHARAWLGSDQGAWTHPWRLQGSGARIRKRQKIRNALVRVLHNETIAPYTSLGPPQNEELSTTNKGLAGVEPPPATSPTRGSESEHMPKSNKTGTNNKSDGLTDHHCRVNRLFSKRDKTIEDLIVAWSKRQEAKNTDEEAEEHAVEVLNRAADALVLVHLAMTFEVIG